MKTSLQITKSVRSSVKFIIAGLDKRTCLPILSNVHCYSNGHFEIISTNLDCWNIARFDSQTAIEGKTTLPGKAIADLFTADIVNIECLENSTARCLAGAVSRVVPTLSVDEFPALPSIPAQFDSFDVSPARFFPALKAVAIAQSTDASRYVLNGVCLEISPDEINLIATDGRRLHRATFPRPANDPAQAAQIAALESEIAETEIALTFAEKEFPSAPDAIEATSEVLTARAARKTAMDKLSIFRAAKSILIPSATVKQLLKMPIAKGETTLRITSWTIPSTDPKDKAPCGWARFDCANHSIITKQIDGNYPNYRQVIPSEFLHDTALDVATFAGCIAQAEKACSEKSNSVKIVWTDHDLIVIGKSPDNGEISVPMTTARAATKPLSIAFNPEYVGEICEAFKLAGQMDACFIDELSPGVFKSNPALSPELPYALLAVVMPMRLS